MAARIYVNTFGAKGERSFSAIEDYHFQVMQALTERGYIPVEGGVLAKGESWVSEDGGFVVHAKLGKGGKAVFFMTQTEETAKKVVEAVRLSIPGIGLEEPIRISVPE